MKKRLITMGPSIDPLLKAMKMDEPIAFEIDGVEHEVIPHGMEMVDPTQELYDLKVTVLNLRMPNKQHFRYSPPRNKGEWLGHFDLDHKAYEGHSSTAELDDLRYRTKPRGWPYEG